MGSRVTLPSIGQILSAHRAVDEVAALRRADDGEHIYFLLWADRLGVSIRYIGRSRHLRARIEAHKTRWPALAYARASVIEVTADSAAAVEGFYVSLINPPFNVRTEGTRRTDELLEMARAGRLWGHACS